MHCSEVLARGGIAVIPTDTLYGVVASAQDEAAVERVYALKGRAPEKPCIILIASLDDLKLFGITLNDAQRAVLDRSWPGPVSVVLPCGDSVPEYLHRGTHTLAFRLPDDESLRALVQKVGPLIAPSANPQSLAPATTFAEARGYFGDRVDCYLDGGTHAGKASKLISLSETGEETVLRP